VISLMLLILLKAFIRSLFDDPADEEMAVLNDEWEGLNDSL
jgi:hypothetical protein